MDKDIMRKLFYLLLIFDPLFVCSQNLFLIDYSRLLICKQELSLDNDTIIMDWHQIYSDNSISRNYEGREIIDIKGNHSVIAYFGNPDSTFNKELTDTVDDYSNIFIFKEKIASKRDTTIYLINRGSALRKFNIYKSGMLKYHITHTKNCDEAPKYDTIRFFYNLNKVDSIKNNNPRVFDLSFFKQGYIPDNTIEAWICIFSYNEFNKIDNYLLLLQG